MSFLQSLGLGTENAEQPESRREIAYRAGSFRGVVGVQSRVGNPVAKRGDGLPESVHIAIRLANDAQRAPHPPRQRSMLSAAMRVERNRIAKRADRTPRVLHVCRYVVELQKGSPELRVGLAPERVAVVRRRLPEARAIECDRTLERHGARVVICERPQTCRKLEPLVYGRCAARFQALERSRPLRNVLLQPIALERARLRVAQSASRLCKGTSHDSPVSGQSEAATMCIFGDNSGALEAASGKIRTPRSSVVAENRGRPVLSRRRPRVARSVSARL